MTTSGLMDKARLCAELRCTECPYDKECNGILDVVEQLTDKLAMAYEDLKKDEHCHDCIYYDYVITPKDGYTSGYQNINKYPCDICRFDNSQWQWRGDAE